MDGSTLGKAENAKLLFVALERILDFGASIRLLYI
jgi:hypothetical protein